MAGPQEKPDACWNCGLEDGYTELDTGMFECSRCGDLLTRP